ncbi:MAG: glycosyltransferase family 39 protein [Elusimicrobia bacterium]|nr:glycosyltransferase family 39 protein [Elusimicrobiota bacterium]
MRSLILRASVVAVATGLTLGLGLGIMIAESRIVPAALAVAIGAAVVLGAGRLVPSGPQRTTVMLLLAFAFGLRLAVGVLLHVGSLALGREGFVTGDDREYAALAWGWVGHSVGLPTPPYVPPYWNGEAYLFGTYVYLLGGLFAVFGPDLLVPIAVNVGFGTLMVALVYDMARRLFGPSRALLAAGVVAVFPSVVLWSALNLKDALALAIIAAALWAMLRFQEGPRVFWLVLAFLVLWPMETLRRYLYLGLLIVLPIAVWVAPRLGLAQRLRWGAGALALSAALILTNQASSAWLGPGTLVTLEFVRQQMSRNARTGFVDRPHTIARAGDTYYVPGPSPSGTPRIVVVPPNALIVVQPSTGQEEPAPAATPTPAAPTPFTPTRVVVNPGDIVVVGAGDATPGPTEQRRALPAASLQLTPVGDEGIAIRTIGYLPKGLAFALFAPFPWAIDRTLDLLTVPEMLAWYLLLPAAGWSVFRHRERWRTLAPISLFVVGTLLVFALAQGNVGTLFRHRGMLVPFVVVLASPTLWDLGARLVRGRVTGAPVSASVQRLDTRA